jgi:hypothetical protein
MISDVIVSDNGVAALGPLKNFTNEQIKKFFFAKDASNPNKWTCETCKLLNRTKFTFTCQVGAGSTNFISHVHKNHTNYQTLMTAALTSEGHVTTNPDEKINIMTAFGSNPAAQVAYFWIRLIVEENNPITICNSQLMREGSKYRSFNSDTIIKYIANLRDILKNKIIKTLPAKFGIMFDGWSAGGQHTHYVAVYGCFLGKSVLLGFQPLLDETNQNTENHCDFIRYTLAMYRKDVSNVLFLVGDNMNTNTAIADQLCVPLVGCAAHRLNLACKQYSAGKTDLIAKVHSLMVTLSTNNNIGELR